MLCNSVRVGMKVKINSIEQTHALYKSNEDMKAMVGKTVIIKSIINNSIARDIYLEDKKVTFEGPLDFCVWSPSDLTPISTYKNISKKKFDIKQLIL